MAEPSEKLADSLKNLKKIQDNERVAIRSKDLTRTHRERLLKNGFLQEVIKGWYIPSSPEDKMGESTAWYAAFWPFIADYLNEKYGEQWLLSPEQSLLFHAGNETVPKQLLVKTPKGSNNTINLLHGTSIIDTRLPIADKNDLTDHRGLRVYKTEAALIAAAPNFFETYAMDARAILASVADSSAILSRLLAGGHTAIAGRLAGAFRNIGRDRIADDIVKSMKAADYDVREKDPFNNQIVMGNPDRPVSPYINRIRMMWHSMRKDIIGIFPAPPRSNDIEAYLKDVSDIYVTDAYHSLSIEGYRVSEELIEKVREGNWNPDAIKADQDHKDALAARGYHEAFEEVKKSLEVVLRGENSGKVADNVHGDWYRSLFAPSVAAGILKASDLAGYRNIPVYIRSSRHTPPSPDAIREALPAFFELLSEEADPAVRVVLGHFIFVYIHPYIDGNGRMGRFLMNLMLAGGGYPWTVITVDNRTAYMEALEAASVEENITPFAAFLAEQVKQRMAEK